MENSILRMENITKKFGEFTANQSISLESVSYTHLLPGLNFWESKIWKRCTKR